MQLTLVTGCLLLNVHQWSNKNLVPMCAKVISISYTCWATYNNQQTTPGQDVHKFYPFQPLFLAYREFQKYQTKVANFAPRLGGPTAECLQLQGGGWSLTMGSVPEPRWRLCPSPPLYSRAPRSPWVLLAPSVHPTVLDLATPLATVEVRRILEFLSVTTQRQHVRRHEHFKFHKIV